MKGAVAAGHELTAGAAAEVLAEGGNAFDAVLAGLFAACASEAVLASIGGGGFLMAHSADRNRTQLYDFFCNTPHSRISLNPVDFRAVVADFGTAKQEFHIGAGAMAWPGVPAGVIRIHRDLCSLPLERLVAPAQELARKGVILTEFEAYLFRVVAPILTASPEVGGLFAPCGHTLRAGERFVNPDLATALERLAAAESQTSIGDPFAEILSALSRNRGGFLTQQDGQNYSVAVRAPLQVPFGTHQIALNPAPAAGGALVGFGLRLLSELGAAEKRPSAIVLLRALEATNRARAAAEGGPGELLSRMALDVELNKVRSHMPSSQGTTHISVIDHAGNAAALTVSNGAGNSEVLPGLGVVMNNMLGEEDLNPVGFHRWQLGERLSSMMCPTLISGGDGSLTALGSGGSNRIRSAVLQVCLNLATDGMSLKDAVGAARMHLEKTGVLDFEDDFSPEDRRSLLEQRPDAVIWPERGMYFGGVHSVRRHASGKFEAFGDPRRSGAAIIVS